MSGDLRAYVSEITLIVFSGQTLSKNLLLIQWSEIKNPQKQAYCADLDKLSSHVQLAGLK